MARYLIASVGFWRCFISAGIGRELVRVVLRKQGLVTELLLRKDGGKVEYIEDTRTCVGMEVRVCTGGGQSRKRADCSTGCGTGQA